MLALWSGTLTINNGIISADTTCCALYVDGASLTLDNLTVTNIYSDSDAVVIVNGTLSILSGTYSGDYAAVEVDGGNVAIFGGNYVGDEDAVYATGGATTLTAGHFKATTDGYGDGCLTEYGGSLALASGSTASVTPWKTDSSATDVTVSAGASNADLSTLRYSVDGSAPVPVPSFSAGQTTYSIPLPSGAASGAAITIIATAAAAGRGATLAVTPPGFALSGGAGTATVTVTAADGVTTKTYTLNFTAPANFETNGMRYNTLEEAVAAVPNNGTIIMLNDVEISDYVVLNRDISYALDLGGHILSTTGQPDAALVLWSGTVTIKNGTISADTTISALYVDGASVTLDGLTVTNTYSDAFAVVFYDGTLSILSGTYSGDSVAVVGVGSGNLSILGGDYVGKEDAVFVQGGTATLTAGHFKSTADGYGDGCLVEGGGSIALASGSTATVNSSPSTASWLGEATEVTVSIIIIIPPGPGPAPAPTPTPMPTPTPTPASGSFSDGDTLAAGGAYTAPSGTPSFCLGGNPGSAPATLRIDNVPYTITPLAANTCFELFSTSSGGRALILDSGSADISSIVPGAPLLEARNGDLVANAATHGSTSTTIRASVDPVCTSTRVTVLEGEVSAPDWILTPPPNTGCPADALTPPQSRFMVSDGRLSCVPGALRIKGTYANLTLKETQNLGNGQQFFVVAGYAPAGWFQNNSVSGWILLQDPFLPLDTATGSGDRTEILVERLDIRAIPGTELYVGHGANVDEMMLNGRYCGVFRMAP
ncbi:MAG: hypothetical protein FWD77_09955 [Betaproteobacteria bacterium]|nr:hypothetical protein [Betaproteobacteria bacterium]